LQLFRTFLTNEPKLDKKSVMVSPQENVVSNPGRPDEPKFLVFEAGPIPCFPSSADPFHRVVRHRYVRTTLRVEHRVEIRVAALQAPLSRSAAVLAQPMVLLPRLWFTVDVLHRTDRCNALTTDFWRSMSASSCAKEASLS
jgi:hypothetical protein